MMIAPIFRASPESVVDPMMIPAAAQAVAGIKVFLAPSSKTPIKSTREMRDSFRTKETAKVRIMAQKEARRYNRQ
jgi:hypothetical protein